MSDELVLFDVDARGVAHVTLNRPAVHNCFNDQVIERLLAIVTEISARKDIRVVVIRGEGKSFSAGGDLEWMRRSGQQDYATNLAQTMVLARLFKTLNDLPQAVVSLVQGNCMAGGTGLVSCSDIAVATRDTKFALTEVRLGLSPATISPYVVAAIGQRQARRYFLTGERFEAAEAQRVGLVHELADNMEDLKLRGERLVNDLLQGAPGAIADSKLLIREVAYHGNVGEDVMQFTAKNIADRRASEEGQEGLASFFAKRKPAWTA